MCLEVSPKHSYTEVMVKFVSGFATFFRESLNMNFTLNNLQTTETSIQMLTAYFDFMTYTVPNSYF